MKTPVRRATAADLPALLALEQSFPGDRLSRRCLARLLGARTAEIWVATGDAGVVAAAVMLYRARSRRARLYSLVVAASMRGHGVGARLLQAAQAAALQRGCDALALEVRGDNAAAIALYRKHGFHCVRVIPGYYQDGQAALRMARVLVPAHPPQDARPPVPALARVA